MHDVFLSYASADKTVADMACAVLERAGVRVWIAPRDVPPGSDYPAQLTAAIEACKVLLAVWSEHFDASEHTKREVEIAVSSGKHILPLRIADVPMGASSRYFFAGKHWLDAITPPIEAHLEKLAGTVKTLLGQELPQVPVRDRPRGRGRRWVWSAMLVVVLASIGVGLRFLLQTDGAPDSGGGGPVSQPPSPRHDSTAPEVAESGRSEPTRFDPMAMAGQVVRGQDRALAERHAEMLQSWGNPKRAAPPRLAVALAAAPRIAAFPSGVAPERNAIEQIVSEGLTEVRELLRVERDSFAQTSKSTRAVLDDVRALAAMDAVDPPTVDAVEAQARRLDALDGAPGSSPPSVEMIRDARAKVAAIRDAANQEDRKRIEDFARRLDALEPSIVSIETCENAMVALRELDAAILELRRSTVEPRADVRKKLLVQGEANPLTNLRRSVEAAESMLASAAQSPTDGKPPRGADPAPAVAPAQGGTLRTRVASWSGRTIPTIWMRTLGNSRRPERRDWRVDSLDGDAVVIAVEGDNTRGGIEAKLVDDLLQMPVPRFAADPRNPTPLRFTRSDLPTDISAGTLSGHLTLLASRAPRAASWFVLDVEPGVVLLSSSVRQLHVPNGEDVFIEGGKSGLDPFVGSEVEIPISVMTNGHAFVLHGSMCIADRHPVQSRKSVVTVELDGTQRFREIVGERRRVDFAIDVPAGTLAIRLGAKPVSGDSFTPQWNCVWLEPAR